jgi:isopentenyl-diphosphate Delta-isomerase
MFIEQEVILVNDQDTPVGTMEKLEAHRKGLLHRAFSVFIFNNKGEMLLQQRAGNKYHSGGLWTNACCSHPVPGKDITDCARKRLQEEMGFFADLQKIFEFTYQHKFENGLTEHEYDHVFVGMYNGIIMPDGEEVQDYCFKSLEEIQASLVSHPQKYTPWFGIAFPRVEQWAKTNISIKACA